MRWRSSSMVSVKRRAIADIRTWKAAAQDNADLPLFTWAERSQKASRVNAMVELMKPYVEIDDDRFDADPGVFNTKSGTIDLRTGEVHDHRADDFLTRVAGCGFDPEAGCPTWESFLDRVFGRDTELVSYVQRAVGATLLGSTSEHVLFFPYGTGANGKTTFVETLHHVFGGYAAKTPIDTFMKRRPGAATNDLARLAGIRMVSAVESDIDRRLAEGLVKAMTGSDTVAVRFHYKEFFEFRPEFTPWIATNHLPSIEGTDYGIWRRVKVIPFTVTIPPAQQDHDLLAKLQAEGPGIARWAVEGAMAFHERGLDEPASITTAVDSYRRTQDPVGQWIEATCDEAEGAWTATAHLAASFNRWAAANSYSPMTRADIARRLRALGYRPEKRRVDGKQVRGWAGIAATGDNPADPSAAWSQQG